MGVSQYGAAADHAALSGNSEGDPHRQYSMVLVGLASARPAPGTAGMRPGTTYVATDTHVQTVYDGATWLEPGLTPAEANADYARLAADNILSGRNTFTDAAAFIPEPRNAFPVEYEPAGTNLNPNPSFEVDLGGWSPQGAATIVRDTTQFVLGVASLRADVPTGVNSDGVIGAGTATDSVPAGSTLTISAWLRASAAKTLRFRIRWGSTAGLVAETEQMVSVTTAWQRFALTAVAPAGTQHAAIKVLNNGTDQGAFSFWVDGAQVERSTVATSYIDGSLGEGFAWTGTAHASTSTRAADTVLRVARDAAGTNLVGNPRFANNLSGWILTNSPVSFARDTFDTFLGEGVARVQTRAVAASDGIEYRVPAVAGEGPFTMTAVIRAPAGKVMYPGIHYYDSAGALVAGSVAQRFTTTGGWDRLVLSSTVATPAGTASVGLNIRKNDQTADAFEFLVGFAQLEARATATSLIDGSLGTGYAWTGTPHASTSTRAADTVIPAQVKTLPPYGLVAEGEGRNLLPNPRFEIDLFSWRPNYADTALSRVTGPTPVGSAAARVGVRAGTATPYDGITYNFTDQRMPARPGQVSTLSAWIRGTPGKVITLLNRAFNEGGLDGQGALSITLTADWRRYSVVATAGPNANHWVPYLENNGTDQGAYEFFVAGYQLELGNTATSYIDGSLGPGYEWEGTPHASPSRRTAGTKIVGSGDAVLGPVQAPSLRPQVSLVGASESTTSTGFTSLATTQDVFVTAPPSGSVLVICGMASYASPIAHSYMGFSVYNGWTDLGSVFRAADDLTAAYNYGDQGQTAEKTTLINLVPGQRYRFRALFRVGANTGYFYFRHFVVVPVL